MENKEINVNLRHQTGLIKTSKAFASRIFNAAAGISALFFIGFFLMGTINNAAKEGFVMGIIGLILTAIARVVLGYIINE